MTQRSLETYEVGSPWVVYTYKHSDRWSRITGRSKILMRCSICDGSEMARIRIPRFGPVPAPRGGRHPVRVDFVRRHQHTVEERTNRLMWSKPLRNLAVTQPTDEDIRRIIMQTYGDGHICGDGQ